MVTRRGGSGASGSAQRGKDGNRRGGTGGAGTHDFYEVADLESLREKRRQNVKDIPRNSKSGRFESKQVEQLITADNFTPDKPSKKLKGVRDPMDLLMTPEKYFRQQAEAEEKARADAHAKADSGK